MSSLNKPLFTSTQSMPMSLHDGETVPFRPRTFTVSWPGPAPRVSTTNVLWYVASSPLLIPSPETRTILALGAAVTFRKNGLPVDQTTIYELHF